MKWFRLYDEFQHDTKLRRMPIPHRYAFVILLCMANRSSVRGVILNLDDEDLAFELEMQTEDWLTLKAKFRAKGLIEPVQSGIKITNWDDRQFASDSSAERVAAYRRKKTAPDSNVTVTLLKRDCNALYTDTDSNSDPENRSRKQIQTEEINRVDSDFFEPEILPEPIDAEIVNPQSVTGQSSPDSAESQIAPIESSAAPLSKDAFLARFYATYNERRPTLWGRVAKGTAKRDQGAKKLLLACGGEKGEALRVLSDALAFCSQDPWWASKSLGLDTLLAKDNAIALSERWEVLATVPGAQQAIEVLADPAKARFEREMAIAREKCQAIYDKKMAETVSVEEF